MNTKIDLWKRKYLGLIAAGIVAVFLMGCGSAGAGDGGDGGGGGAPGGGGGGAPTTALVEGTMAVSGDAEGAVSFSFEIPVASSSYTAKELKSATGILLVSGGIGSFKIGLVGTYDSVTGNYDLAAEGNLLGIFISIVVRGQIDANRNFMESHVSVTTLDSEGNLKVSSGTGAQKPGTEGDVKNQVQNSGASSVTQVSPGDDSVLSQFLGTWYGSVPSFMSGIAPEPDEIGSYTKVILRVSSKSFSWIYATNNYATNPEHVVTGMIKSVYNSINSTDQTQQQHYVLEFKKADLGMGSGPIYMNIRAKDKSTGRQMNVYLDNGPNTGSFPANLYETAEEAAQETSRTKQRDAIVFSLQK